LQAKAAGIPKAAYIHKIVVSGEYINIYVSASPTETVGNWNNLDGSWYWGKSEETILRDLDSSRFFKILKLGTYDRGALLTFQNVKRYKVFIMMCTSWGKVQFMGR
jgi:hypothetical protein